MDATRTVRLLVLLSAGGLLGCGLHRRRRRTRVERLRHHARTSIIDQGARARRSACNGQSPDVLPGRSAQRRDQRPRRRSPPRPRRRRRLADRDAGRCASTRGRGRRVASSAPAPRPSDPCELTFSFAAVGVPRRGAVFRVASRLREPDGAWTMAAPPTVDTTVESADVRYGRAPATCRPARRAAASQFAVLVFLAPPGSIPDALRIARAERHRLRVRHRRVRARGHHHRPAAHRDGRRRSRRPRPPRPVGPTPTATPDVPRHRSGHHLLRRGARRQCTRSLRAHSIRWAARSTSGRSASALSLIVEGEAGNEPSPDRGVGVFDDGRARPAADSRPPARRRQRRRVRPPAARHRRRAGRRPLRVQRRGERHRCDERCRLSRRRRPGQPQCEAGERRLHAQPLRRIRLRLVRHDVAVLPADRGTVELPPGDTIVAARLRDSSGNLGAAREIVVRNASSSDATPTPTAPSGPTDPPPPTTTHPADTPTTAPSATAIPATDTPTADGSTPTPTPTATPSRRASDRRSAISA